MYKSDRVVARFLRDLNVPFKSDTAYVFLVPPMTAARIEGAINPFIALLRKAGVKADIITLAVSNRRRAAANYLFRRAFSTDYNLVVSESFLNSFVFSAGSLQVPFITKFNVRTGEMLSSYSLMGRTDTSTIAWFISDLSKPRAKRPAGMPKTMQIKTDAYEAAEAKRLKLVDTDEHPLSTTYHIRVNPSGTRAAIWDRLSYYIYVFDLSSGKLVNALRPDSSEEMAFISVPRPLYQSLKRDNLVNPMYLNESFWDDTTLLISASLPSISMTVKDNDTNIAVANSPVIIKKNIACNTPLGYVHLQRFPDTIDGAFRHAGASFVPECGLIFAPYMRGWPEGAQMLSDSTPPEDNPFSDEFYRQDDYKFAAFDLEGNFRGFWGRLGSRFEDLKLGYLNHGGLARFRDEKYYLSDQCSGQIYVYDRNATLQDSVRVFDDPPLVFPAIDRSKEPERYMLEAFKQNFKARIVDFIVTDDYCYALVLWDQSQPIVYKVGLDDHTNRKYALPTKYQEKDAKHFLLRETPAGVVTASLLESGDETWYCEFKLP